MKSILLRLALVIGSFFAITGAASAASVNYEGTVGFVYTTAFEVTEADAGAHQVTITGLNTALMLLGYIEQGVAYFEGALVLNGGMIDKIVDLTVGTYNLVLFSLLPADVNISISRVADVAQVPVPAALPLLLAALGGLGIAGRRRKAATPA
ncbi:MAG: VPLPA-CTERM sorting domain-containing protein [Pseudomonadota bacterium]|nr:VPLPA-CTERM sorting domain-containing protein [Pseudomonadota bacterium]